MIMRTMPRRCDRGLTMIELITVLVVLGVLVSIVAPSMRGMMQRQRVQGVHDQLITDLQFARSELTAGGGSVHVGVAFGSDATRTCYTIHTDTDPSSANCDCTRAPGAACLPAAGVREIKTAQVALAQGVSLAASSPGGTRLTLSPPQGVAAPAGLTITVQGDTGGQLRTTVGPMGTPSVCTPDGSMRGVPTCSP
jgi:prepilin-type N-terminal cleavage/methylation domain-containing protein